MNFIYTFISEKIEMIFLFLLLLYTRPGAA
jgi:hypothetical protein